MPGIVAVDIIKPAKPDEKAALIDAAVKYWEKEGYELLTDEEGPDVLFVRQTTTLPASGYEPGPTLITPNQGGVVLVFVPKPPKKKAK